MLRRNSPLHLVESEDYDLTGIFVNSLDVSYSQIGMEIGNRGGLVIVKFQKETKFSQYAVYSCDGKTPESQDIQREYEIDFRKETRNLFHLFGKKKIFHFTSRR